MIQLEKLNLNTLNRTTQIELADLYSRVFAGPPYFEEFSRMNVQEMLDALSDKDYRGWLASEQESLIGFTWGYGCIDLAQDMREQIKRDFDPQNTFFIAEVGVDPDSRRQGIGRSLTGRLLTYVDETEIPLTLLRTGKYDNEAAIGLYQSLGFSIESYEVEVENLRNDGTIGYDTRIFMARGDIP